MASTLVVPYALYLRMWSRLFLDCEEWTRRILDAFESVPELMPTHWGPDERGRSKYNREDAIAYAASVPQRNSVPTLRRARPPTYLAYASTPDPDWPFSLNFDLDPPQVRAEDLLAIYRLGDALAQQMEPEFGLVHPTFLDEDCRSLAEFGAYKESDFARYGPRGLAIRTWLGPHVLGLLGRDRLARVAALGVVVEDTPWGGVRVDLGAPPWATDCRALLARHAEAMGILGDSGIFGDYSGLVPRPGPGWVRPAPVPARQSPAQVATPSLPPAAQRLWQAVLLKQEVADGDVEGLDLKYIDLSELKAPGLKATGAHLEGARLTEAYLFESWFTDAHLDDAQLDGANLGVSSFNGVSLRNASLQRVTFALAFCDNADLTEADLTEANLEHTSFSDSRFDRAVLRKAKASHTLFDGASLVGADLSGGQFAETLFRNADLTGADLSEGDFSEADFRGARLSGVKWDGAKLDGARFDQVNGAAR